MGEWINVNDRLPEESGEVLVYTKGKVYMCCSYSSEHRLFNAFDGGTYESAHKHSLDVAYWMPLTKPITRETDFCSYGERREDEDG